jgi:lipopolysaccharide heptosyltransferase II
MGVTFGRLIRSNRKVRNTRRLALVHFLHHILLFVAFPLLLFNKRTKEDLRPSAMREDVPILLIRVDLIGDFVMTYGIFAEFRRLFPRGRIDLLCCRQIKNLAERALAEGVIDGYFLMDLHWKVADVVANFLALRKNRYAVAVDLRGDVRGTLLAYALAIPRRIGMAYAGFDYLNTSLIAHGVDHVSAEMIEVLRLFNPAAVDIRRIYAFPRLRTNEIEFARRILDDATSDRAIAVHMTSSQQSRMWPVEHYVSLLTRLCSMNYQIVFLGSAEEASGVEAVNRQLGERGISIAGKASLFESAAVIARCRLFIGNDSGPSHIAAALGRPSVVLYGPGNPAVTGQIGPQVRKVCSPRRCDPRCSGATCAVPEASCVKAIAVEDVLRASFQLLEVRDKQ